MFAGKCGPCPLGDIGPEAKAAVPKLIERSLTRTQCGEHAAEALGLMGTESISAIPRLIETLGDKEYKVRRDAVRRWARSPSRQGRPSRHQGIIQG